MKTKLSYAVCSITVQGLDMNCPLCGVLVESGNSHQCSKPEASPLTQALTWYMCSLLMDRNTESGRGSCLLDGIEVLIEATLRCYQVERKDWQEEFEKARAEGAKP